MSAAACWAGASAPDPRPSSSSMKRHSRAVMASCSAAGPACGRATMIAEISAWDRPSLAVIAEIGVWDRL